MDNEDEKCKIKILFLPKWFPNKEDSQLGIFIKKQAQAISTFCNVFCLNICSSSEINTIQQIEYEEDINITHCTIYYKKSKFFLLNIFRYLLTFFKGYQIALKKMGKPDFIHAHVFTRPAVLAFLLYKLKKIPYFISEHWTGYLRGEYAKFPFWKKLIIRKIAKEAETVICVSEFLQESMTKCNIPNVKHIIANVVEFSEKSYIKEQETSKIIILTIADLFDDRKNISAVIKAISEIYKSIKNIEYHIIGGGYDEIFLLNLAKELGLLNNVIFFHGRQSNDYVLDFLPQANFVVTNSNFETFSVATAEAIACGIPVIATRCGGPESFVNETNGIIIPRNNSAELTRAILWMCENFQTYNSQEISKEIRMKFSSETIGKQLFELYRFYKKKQNAR